MLLLDADILIDVLRRHPPALAWIDGMSDSLAIPGYAAMELVTGCHNAFDLQRVERLTASLELLWLSPAGADSALTLYKRLRLSHRIGLLDTLHAQTAMEFRQPLHTFNVKHYSAVPSLRTIQPYTR